jgi:hypothetical protein
MVKRISKEGKAYLKFEATKLNWKPSYTKILYYVQKNLPDSKISELVGMSHQMIALIRNSPYFQEKLNHSLTMYEKRRSERLADIQSSDVTMTKLEKSARSAATILVKALKGDNSITKTQISVAKDLLDRTGYKAKEKMEIETTTKSYSPEEISSAQATILEMTEALDRLSQHGSSYLVSEAGSTEIRGLSIDSINDLDVEVTPADLALETKAEFSEDTLDAHLET